MLMSLRCALPLVAGLLLAWSPIAFSDSPTPKDRKATKETLPPRTDRNSDPLPIGAVARLGSPHLVNPDANILAFLPDGKTLAVAAGGTLRLWDVGSGRERRRFTTPLMCGVKQTRILCLAVSPDGKLLAGGCMEGGAQVWEADSGKELRQLGEKNAFVSKLIFSPDGKRLATWAFQGPVRVWDVAGGGCLATIGNFSAVQHLSFSADGKILTTSHREPPDWKPLFLTRWDSVTGKELRKSKVKLTEGSDGCLSPDGRFLADCTEDSKALRLIDVDTGKEVRRTEGDASGFSFFGFSTSGSLMISTSENGIACVWETATGKLCHRVQVPQGRNQRVALSHDSKILAVSNWKEQEIRLYDVASGKPLHAFGGHRSGPLTVAFAPDGKTVVTVSREAVPSQPVREWAAWSLRQWNPASGKELSVTRADLGGEVHFNVFSPDGRLLVTVTHDGTFRLWDVVAGRELRRWKVPVRYTRFIVNGKETARSPSPAVTSPVFSANGKVLFAAGEKTIHRWETDTGKELPAVAHEVKWMVRGCFATGDTHTVLVLGSDRPPLRLVLLDLDAGKMVRQFSVGRSFPRAVAVSPDGRTLAFQDGKDIRLLEVESGQERGKLSGGTEFVEAITFSRDGRFLAVSGHRDNAIRVWQLPSSEPARKLEGMEEPVNSLAFSPDGRRLVSGGYSNTALVWDVAGLFGPTRPAPELSPRDLETLWDNLAGVYHAVWKLAASPGQSVPFLTERLKAQPTPDPRRIARLIADLDSNRFKVRQQATEELERLGPKAASALRKALQGQPTLETRMRLGRLLEQLEKPGAPSLPTEELVGLRVLEALELAGTAEAQRTLEAVTHGTEERWASEAKGALERLTRRAAARR
jgi:WD40 repeat protein